MTKRFVCKSKQKHSCNGYDEKILRQLPIRWQVQFPCILTHRSGVSKDLAERIRSEMQNSVGPHRVSKTLEEGYYREHDLTELQYLDAARRYTSKATIHGAFAANHNKIKEFSKFSDNSKYNGSCPTPKFISHVYTAYITTLRPKIEHQMSMLDGKILKHDHSFKIIKHLKKINNKPISKHCILFAMNMKKLGQWHLFQPKVMNMLSHL
jgi:hypothetical protein